ncbi:hypothetical protein CAEBREN_02346 [Caenorhabditis brenneri]|uniref:F-box domain-containing protein n=1 Tax=Caenorhabditis brenneri TaxID=135651 RepID=G0N887_CAEBE|nr:hypothetical protein CAEBREN_02346 [Caenorhabditis brenneri]
MVDLSVVPAHVTEIIVEHLDVLSRLMFRKTCTDFRGMVDRDHLFIKNLHITYYYNSIEIDDKQGFQVNYQDIGGLGTLVQCDKEHELHKGKNFIELFKIDLRALILNRNLTIGTLHLIHEHHVPTSILIRDDPEAEVANARIDGRIMNIFNDLENQLRVENLVARMRVPWELKKVFIRLNPNSIKSLKFEVDYGSNGLRQLFRSPDFLRSEQLRRLTSFHSEEPFDLRDLHKIAHCSVIEVKVMRRLTEEQIEMVKAALFTNPNLNQLKISVSWSPRAIPMPEMAEEPFWRSAPYPGNPRIRISWRCRNDEAEFRGPRFSGEVAAEKEKEEEIPVLRAPRNFFDDEFD